MSKEKTPVQQAIDIVDQKIKNCSGFEDGCPEYVFAFKEVIEVLESIRDNQEREALNCGEKLAQFAVDFIEAVESEEIIISNNFDNDGFENAGQRLFLQAESALVTYEKYGN